MEQTEVIHQYADLVGFRIGQLSTDFTETVPRKGFEEEWKRAKETMSVLADIYKRVEADQFCPEPEDKEKLYAIIVATHLSCPKINQIDCHRMSRYNGISLKKGKVPGHLQFRHR